MSEPTPRRPSVSSLASILIRRDPVAQRSENRVILARPPLLTRLLIAIALVMTLAFAGGFLALYHGIGGLIESLRRDRAARDAHDRADLPADAVLLDPAGWHREIASRPLAAANLNLARCRLLAAAQRWQELDDTVQGIGQVAPGDILPQTRLLHAEALAALDRPAEAGTALAAVDAQRLNSEEREHAADLAARIWSRTALTH